MTKCYWNPRDLVESKISTCKSDDHEGKRRGLSCRLVMTLADDGFSGYDVQQYISGTEKYYCDECYEELL